MGRLLIGAAVAVAIAGCSVAFGEGRMHSMCEAVIKERLRAPSTYQRIKVSRYVTEMDPVAWVAAWKEDSAEILAIRQREADQAVTAGKPLQEVMLFFEYDAANAFGTPIRELASCQLLTSDEDEGELARPMGDYRLRVDGFTKSEWLREQVRQLSDQT